MGFSEIFRSILGLNNYSDSNNGLHSEFRNPIWNVDDDDDDTEDELHHDFGGQYRMFPGDSFNVFSDPLEMARYAEHQMEKMMSMFNSMMSREFGNNFFQPPGLPMLPYENPSNKQEGISIRDEYLKPGYSKALMDKQMDSDIDKEISDKNFDTVLDNISKLQKDKPDANDGKDVMIKNPGFNDNIYFKQVITKSVLSPDGTLKTTRIVRNQDGTEETTNIVTQHRNKDQSEDVVSPHNTNVWSNIFGFSFQGFP